MTNAKTSVLNVIFLEMAFQCYSFALLLRKNCIYFQPIGQAKFFPVYQQQINKSTNLQILGKFVVFEKFSSVYEHQIALKVILLPIKIDNMYDRKQIKT